ncbi:MAG: single-stranded DNA-binding protein [Kordia sp.]|uniref:single-stranded DNA-binding protein n=1 Tax=Kordia sp. TaxID=1965332 RepID=UPI003859B838
MAINNTIELIGNMNKNGVRIIESEESTFAVLSLATTDSYKEEESGEWKNKDTLWHDLIAFSPSVIEILKGLNSKARVKITGTLSYRTFPVEIDLEENGKSVTKVINKKEASIIVRRVEQAPLPKKK